MGYFRIKGRQAVIETRMKISKSIQIYFISHVEYSEEDFEDCLNSLCAIYVVLPNTKSGRCIICHAPCYRKICKECYNRKSNRGRYNISVI